MPYSYSGCCVLSALCRSGLPSSLPACPTAGRHAVVRSSLRRQPATLGIRRLRAAQRAALTLEVRASARQACLSRHWHVQPRAALQCLTTHHKLTAICRLSRAFRVLPVLAFLRDSITDVLPSARGTVTEGGLLCQLRFLKLYAMQPEQPGRYTPLTCRRSLRSLPWLSALQELHIRVRLPVGADWTASLLHPPLRAVPAVAAGAARGDIVPWTDPCYQWMCSPEMDCELSSTAPLRRLTLAWMWLSVASVLRLCSLPLE